MFKPRTCRRLTARLNWSQPVSQTWLSKMLRGSTEGVRQGVRQLCKDFSGGHWIVAPANHLQDDIPAENVCALYDTVKRMQQA